MATNLDRSLDEILQDKKKAGRGPRRGQKAAPVGGIAKRSSNRLQKKSAATAATAATTKKVAPAAKKEKNDTKIVVSNLPYDISEPMIKDYFSKVVGPVKRSQISYNAKGTSTGVATIEFARPGLANVAYEQYNGRLVDGRPMKVEIVVDPTKVSLAERIGAAPKPAKAAPAKDNKAKPKAVTAEPRNAAKGGRNARGGKGGAGRGGKRTGSGAQKKTPKTAEQLDMEMDDYFKPAENGAAAPAAASAADNAAMEDL